MTHYSESETLTALCIWEAMLEAKRIDAALNAAWSKNGTATMRQAAVSFAKGIDRAWTILEKNNPDVIDAFSFDWDFVPAALESVDWTTLNNESPRSIASRIAQQWRDRLAGK